MANNNDYVSEYSGARIDELLNKVDENSANGPDTTPTTGSQHLITSGGVKSALGGKADEADLATLSETVGGIDDRLAGAEGKIPSAASSDNQLADKAFVNDGLGDKASQGSVNAINAKIPTAASADNKLADKQFVNTGLAQKASASDVEAIQNKIPSAASPSNKLATASDVNAKYTKPGSGIPATDLASGVQTSLGKADAALPAADVIDNLTTDNATKALSAKQGKVLDGKVSQLGQEILLSLPNGTIKASSIKRYTEVPFKANIGDSVVVTYSTNNNGGVQFIAVDDSVNISMQGSKSSEKRLFLKQIKKAVIAYGDIEDVDIQLEKVSNEKLLLSGTYFNGGLKRAEQHNCSINAGSTVYVHLEGTAGAGLNYIYDDNTNGYVYIPSGSTSIDTEVTLIKSVIKIQAAFGDLSNCVLTSKEKNWSPTINEIQDKLNEQVLVNSILPSGDSSALELSSSDFEQGNINQYGELDNITTFCIRLKDYRRVAPNTKCTVSIGSGYGIRLFFWDNCYGFISQTDRIDETTGTITIPDKAGFVKIVIKKLSEQAITPSVFDSTHTFVALLDSPEEVPAFPLYCAELNRRVYVGSLIRAVDVPFFAKAGDKIHLKFYASSGVGVSLKNDSDIILQKQVVAGGTSFDGIIQVDTNINNINAAYGDVSYIEIYSEESELYSLPINAPAIQRPANADSGSDFNAETITISQLYGAFDDIINKMPGGSNSYSFDGKLPKYMTKHNIEGAVTPCPDPQSADEIAASTLKIRSYVLTKRNRFAWIAYYPRFAWKNPVSGTVAYTNSCTPRTGDFLYITNNGTSAGWAVASYSPSTGITTTNDVNFKRDSSSDYKGDIIFTKDITGGDLTVFDGDDSSLGTSTYVDLTHRSFNSKSYERIESLDYHTNNKATILLWANEHGPQSDPYEGSIISYRIARDLCYAVDNPFLNYLRNYCKVVIIPCANPYSMDMWAAEQRPGRNNANGVNINRNYDTPGWEVLEDSDKGTAAGSENETQYIMNTVRLFNPDIAVDIHVLGYTTLGAGGSEGKCHYEGHIPAQSYVNKIDEVMLMYGLKLSSYGDATPNTNAKGPDWLYYNNIVGGLIEMNAGEASLSYNGNQHTGMIMQADYTLLLNTLWMWYKENEPLFILRNGGFA